MTYSYVARQPILDREKKTIAYELLFRDGPKNSFPEIEPELATSRLLSDQFLGTEHSSIGDKLGFVNFPYQSLINQIPTLFPKEKIVVEVLEDCEPTDELLSAIKNLHQLGYVIALDDFVPNPVWKRFLPYIHLIKFDIRIVPIAKAAKFIDRLKGSSIEFLAEKVETHEEYQEAMDAGFTLFQGYFFSKPELIQNKALAPSFLTVIQLCKAIASDDIDFNEVEQIITSDVSLSFKLLRHVNSSAYISSDIKSFHQALAYMGEKKLRKFVSLVAIASTKESKPESLYFLSIQRARFCELITSHSSKPTYKSQAFLTGIFSLLDSLLDQSLEMVIESIPVDNEIKDALLTQVGYLGKILTITIAYEQAKWDDVARLSQELKINHDQLAECYVNATNWTEELFDNE